MKLRAEIDLPESADWQTVEDAKLSAVWRRVYSEHERMEMTDLTNKCGSCKYFVLHPKGYSKCSGDCLKGKVWRYRTSQICKQYERREDE